MAGRLRYWVPQVGAVLSERYRLDETLATRSAYVSFLATDVRLGEQFHISVLDPARLTGPHAPTNEFRLNRMLGYRNRHIVRILDVQIDKDTSYVVSEIPQGQTFEDTVSSGTTISITEYFSQIAEALQTIQRVGVHGNLKPNTIYIQDGLVSLVDPYRLLGTLPADEIDAMFVAPECRSDTDDESTGNDVWSLGLLLGWFVAGGPVTPSVSLVRQGVDTTGTIDRLFQEATHPDIADRIAATSEFMTRLRDALRSTEDGFYSEPHIAKVAQKNQSDEHDDAHSSTAIPPADAPVPIASAADADTTDDDAAELISDVEPQDLPSQDADSVELPTEVISETDESVASTEDESTATDASAVEMNQSEWAGFSTSDTLDVIPDTVVKNFEAKTETTDRTPAEPTESIDAEVQFANPMNSLQTVVEATVDGAEAASIRNIEDSSGGVSQAEASALSDSAEADSNTVQPDTADRMDALFSSVERVEAEPALLSDTSETEVEAIILEDEGLSDSIRDDSEVTSVVVLDDDEFEVLDEELVPLDEEGNPSEVGEDIGPVSIFPLQPPKPGHSDELAAALEMERIARHNKSRDEAEADNTSADDVPLSDSETLESSAPAPLRSSTTPVSSAGETPAPSSRHQKTEDGQSSRFVTLAAVAAIVGLIVWMAMDTGSRKDTEVDTSAPTIAERPADTTGAEGEPAPPTAIASETPGSVKTDDPSTSMANVKQIPKPTRDGVLEPEIVGSADVVASLDILETDADEPTEEASQKRKLSPETAAAPDENSEDAADAGAAPSADAGAAPSADAGAVPSADAGAVLAADTAVPVVEAVAGVVENIPSQATNSEDIDNAAAKKEGSTVAAADVAVPKPTGPIETTIPPAKWDCPAGMTEVFRKVKLEREGKKVPGFEIHCMDRREAGGPTRGISLYGAKSACERRGARLCSGKEWRRGCGGRYPYGNSFREDKCNTLSLDGYPRPIRPSGSFKKCRSMWGAYDMVGNVSEWTSDGYVRGGSNNNMDEARCNYAKRRAPGSSSSRVGYRCCADAFLKSDSKKNVE